MQRRDSLVRPATETSILNRSHRSPHRHHTTGLTIVLAVMLVALVLWPRPVSAAGIEAIRGRSYRITPRHGPWMIFVASLQGSTAREAADTLVFELRRLGIPAYTFSQTERTDQVQTGDLLGRSTRRTLKSRHSSISVIAGNYPTIKDWRAQKTLKYIKRFEPKLITGGTYMKTPGRPSPFSGAFLVRNPLLPSDTKPISDLVRQLNRGEAHNLLTNRGHYTLVVATLMGRSHTVKETGLRQAEQSFQVGDSLDQAANKARRMGKILNDKRYLAKLARSNPQLADILARDQFRAFILHERFRSIVTVGEFTSDQDPAIRPLLELFRAKQKPDPRTGQLTLTPEYILVPGTTRSNPLDQILAFDPNPRLMPVPRLK
jgi:hypothetical protein